MGKIKQGILGGFSGKVGNVIGTSWKGISVVKVMPQSVANPRTTAQVSQRNALSYTVAFAVQILGGFIKPMWDRFAQGMSGYNDFISTNISVFDGEIPSEPQNLVMSRGKLSPLGSATLAVNSSAQAVVTHTAGALGTYGSTTDEVYIVLLNASNGKALGTSLTGDRSTTTNIDVNITSLSVSDNDVIHAYLACRRVDGTLVSDSIHTSATANI